MIEHSVARFAEEPWISTVIVVIQRDDRFAARLPALAQPKVVVVPAAGATRRDTVLNGLAAGVRNGSVLPDDWVYVHDAARPGLDRESLLRLASALEDETCGALLCQPVADTVKRVDPVASDFARGRIRSAGTLDRSQLWLAQTPQVFRASALRRALQRHPAVTDEASAIEADGGRPRLIEGTRMNLKITTIEDLILMRVLFDHAAAATPAARAHVASW
jgi:2-C-methyl-D-erythritol 4-phosphate cytidylyltransferase